MKRRRRSGLIFYLLLNILVSAATTLGVLYLWDRARVRPAGLPPQGVAAFLPQPPATDVPPMLPEATNPPPGQEVIRIARVIGAGDLEEEVVLLQRVGEGNLRLTGWQIRGEGGSVFTFPEQPDLVLFADGAVQVYSKPGENTVTDVYWNRSEPAWRSGEILRLLDAQGQERATYRVP
jgi:hypothetical protein